MKDKRVIQKKGRISEISSGIKHQNQLIIKNDREDNTKLAQVKKYSAAVKRKL